MSSHIDALCKVCYFEIHRINLIRKFLTLDVNKKLMVTLVFSKLDYCNSLLSGISQEQILKLQRVQNCVARTIFLSKKSEHITPLLHCLHWLPVNFRIDYKIVLMVFKCLHGLSPTYLSELLNYKTYPRSLRSSTDTTILTMPRTNLKTYGDRSFNFYGPKRWNDLPIEIRESHSLDNFKKAVKTYYFCNFFGL